MGEPQKIGQLLDQLGVTQELDEGDLIPSAVVITKVIDVDGEVSVGIAADEGCSWLEQLGLIEAARNVARSGMERRLE